MTAPYVDCCTAVLEGCLSIAGRHQHCHWNEKTDCGLFQLIHSKIHYTGWTVDIPRHVRTGLVGEMDCYATQTQIIYTFQSKLNTCL